MDSTLQQILRSLCSNSGWKYAVFWKLNHRSPMVFTLEGAYYDNDEQSKPLEVKSCNDTVTNLHSGRYAHDPLGLAVAKMSYHAYSLGEGIVGQVAVSGQHQWIFPEYFLNSYSAYENIWGSQISAGIKTILVVAAGPCGVVQLGSLHKVDEDVTLVTRIRHLFLALNDPFIDHATALLQCSMNSSTSVPTIPSECLRVEAFPDCSGEVDKAVDVEGPNRLLQYASKQSGSFLNTSPLSYLHMEKAVQVIHGHGAGQVSMSGSYQDHKHAFSVDLADAKHENQADTDIIRNALYEGETSSCKDSKRGSDPDLYPYSRNDVLNSADSSAFAIEAGRFFAGQLYSDLDSAVHSVLKMDAGRPHQIEMLQPSECRGKKYVNDSDHMSESQSESSQFDALSVSVSSFAGSELLEALGPAFSKRNTKCEEHVESEPGATARLPDDLNHSQLTFDSSAENLLDAVVANVCHNDSNIRCEIPSSRTMQSVLTNVERAEPSGHAKHDIVSSVGSVINQLALAERSTQQNPSDICGAFSSIGFSSNCPSSSSEQFQTSMEMPKKSKKRAKPGESSRPRPRDRQLIQDRIKELRELVPNGSKCSIDSLLERTIKHMLFLQNVTKHADKLNKCAKSKMQHKENGITGSNNAEQGSSWAVEVGGHLQVCSIVVENLNKQGLMLIEMLCEECSHFLEIANVIKSLDLTILRGVTEAQGEKTWICFVVEGQNSKVMHRMDILWSLVQIFQPKASAKR
ncbi:PREDICTED: transcription factor bHLH155-like [Tarenaya hassleriana]|uniref:transcription factor bHLH155-like n=1 Tax=Tarenaya hassleriana TaxID=28532 RepID=UPI00053C38E2|nr:PREDICTED: transcription factor bHLH155-like [Tarenaya hassleriana]